MVLAAGTEADAGTQVLPDRAESDGFAAGAIAARGSVGEYREPLRDMTVENSGRKQPTKREKEWSTYEAPSHVASQARIDFDRGLSVSQVCQCRDQLHEAVCFDGACGCCTHSNSRGKLRLQESLPAKFAVHVIVEGSRFVADGEPGSRVNERNSCGIGCSLCRAVWPLLQSAKAGKPAAAAAAYGCE